MKPRILPIILMLLGAAGMALFFFTPVMSATMKVVDTPTNTDFSFSLNVFYNGSESIVLKGEELGLDVTANLKIEQDGWGYTGDDEYPMISVYLCSIGLGVAILGMFFSIFGGNSMLRILGAFLGIAGAAACITGCFLMWNFYIAWKEDAQFFVDAFELAYGTSVTYTYNNFFIGWLVPVISCGLIVVGSVFLLAIKPKENIY